MDFRRRVTPLAVELAVALATEVAVALATERADAVVIDDFLEPLAVVVDLGLFFALSFLVTSTPNKSVDLRLFVIRRPGLFASSRVISNAFDFLGGLQATSNAVEGLLHAISGGAVVERASLGSCQASLLFPARTFDSERVIRPKVEATDERFLSVFTRLKLVLVVSSPASDRLEHMVSSCTSEEPSTSTSMGYEDWRWGRHKVFLLCNSARRFFSSSSF